MKGNVKSLLSVVFILFVALAALSLTGCPDTVIMTDDNDGGTQAGRSDYSGTIFKGPFKLGSSVAVLELDTDLLQIGNSYFGDITDDDGAYRIDAAPFTGPVELIATGRFFNEVTGVEDGEITLRALTDEDGTVNINVATAIQRDRIRALVNQGMTFVSAKETAQTELWDAFDWTAFATDSTKIDIESVDGDRLLALSSMIAKTPSGGTRSPAEMSALIVQLRTDFEDGEIDSASVTDLRDAAARIDGAAVRANLVGYYTALSKTVNVPAPQTALESFVSAVPMIPVEYDADNYIHPALAGSQIGDMGMGRNEGFLIAQGATLTIAVTGDTDYFSVTPGDFTEISPGVYQANGLGYRQLGVSFGNIPTDINDNPEVDSYTVTIDVSGADDFSISYTVTHGG